MRERFVTQCFFPAETPCFNGGLTSVRWEVLGPGPISKNHNVNTTTACLFLLAKRSYLKLGRSTKSRLLQNPMVSREQHPQTCWGVFLFFWIKRRKRQGKHQKKRWPCLYRPSLTQGSLLRIFFHFLPSPGLGGWAPNLKIFLKIKFPRKKNRFGSRGGVAKPENSFIFDF